MKKDLTKIFIDEIFTKPPKKNYPTNKIIYNHSDENWGIDLAVMMDYRISNNKGFRYKFVKIDIFSKYTWCEHLKNSEKKANEFSKNLTKSKRKSPKTESDRSKEWCKSIFQNFIKSKNIQDYSRLTEKGPSIAERVIRAVRNLLKKPLFEKGKDHWFSELSSINKQY